MINGLPVAIGFLTRLPLPARMLSDVYSCPRAQAASLAWYPLVGALLGGALAAFAWTLQSAPPLLSAALLLAAWVALTGALHLDGLADSADAWIGGLGNRARTLEIMKDPRSGPAGVIAIVLALLLKFAALASLPPPLWPALLLAPLLGRVALTAAFVTTPYVRNGGLGSGLRTAPRVACLIAIALGFAVCGLFAVRGAVAALMAAVVFAFWRRACLQRLGGITGDTAGALAELVEAAVIVAMVLL